jgi:hypothetical protein
MSLSELGNLAGAIDAVGGSVSGLAADVSFGLNTATGLEGMVSTAGTSLRLAGSVMHARLGIFVFAVNPGAIRLNKQSQSQGNKTPLVESDFQESVRSSSPMTIDLRGIHLVGPTTLYSAEYLMGLATPEPKESAGLAGGGATLGEIGTVAAITGATVPPVTQDPASVVRSTGGKEDYTLSVVEFSWGAFTRLVTVRSVEVNITRFSSLGLPISAELSIGLLEWETFPLARQNPTSGGLPGRSMHTVIAGDSIVRLAVRTYGDPSAWRAVAVANGLDDPLRLEPGQELYLPGPSELSDVLAGDQGFEVSAA